MWASTIEKLLSPRCLSTLVRVSLKLTQWLLGPWMIIVKVRGTSPGFTMSPRSIATMVVLQKNNNLAEAASLHLTRRARELRINRKIRLSEFDRMHLAIFASSKQLSKTRHTQMILSTREALNLLPLTTPYSQDISSRKPVIPSSDRRVKRWKEWDSPSTFEPKS